MTLTLVLLLYLFAFQLLELFLSSYRKRSEILDLRVLRHHLLQLDGSMPANAVNDRRKANAVTLKSTFCLP